jgi:hypothetical protein
MAYSLLPCAFQLWLLPDVSSRFKSRHCFQTKAWNFHFHDSLANSAMRLGSPLPAPLVVWNGKRSRQLANCLCGFESYPSLFTSSSLCQMEVAVSCLGLHLQHYKLCPSVSRNYSENIRNLFEISTGVFMLLSTSYSYVDTVCWFLRVSLLSFTAFNSACYRSVLNLLYFSLKYKNVKIQNYNCACYFVWVCNFFSVIETRKWDGGVWGYGAEKDIRTEEGRGNRGLEDIA